MTLQTGLIIIKIHRLPNISKRKRRPDYAVNFQFQYV